MNNSFSYLRNKNTISTDRLFLDLLTEESHEFIIQLVNSKGWIEFIGDRNVHSKEEALGYINKILGSENIYYWVVSIKEGNIPIGIVSFLKREYLDNFDIGFALLPQFAKNGYAYEASKKILSLVSTDTDPVLATTIPTNINSIKLLTKLGLHFEKELMVGEETLHIYTNSMAGKTAN